MPSNNPTSRPLSPDHEYISTQPPAKKVRLTTPDDEDVATEPSYLPSPPPSTKKKPAAYPKASTTKPSAAGKEAGKGGWHPDADNLIRKLMAEKASLGEIEKQINELPKEINNVFRTKNAIGKRWRKTIKPEMEAGKGMSVFEYGILEKAIKLVEGDEKFTYVAECYGKLLSKELGGKKKEDAEEGEFKTLNKSTAMKLWRMGPPKGQKVKEKQAEEAAE